MFGCPSENPRDCFSGGSFPDKSNDWGDGIGKVRQVAQFDYDTSYWTRTSADGRFVANGGHPSHIQDLLNNRPITIDASYDPGFFPDNNGFTFNGSRVCAQSLLETDDHIDFSEPECITNSDINLYQHMAVGLNGDYFVINSDSASDPGGDNEDPSANWGDSAELAIHPMVWNGTTFDPLETVRHPLPNEGDAVLSPSGELVVGRMAGPDNRGVGYRVHKFNPVKVGDQYQISVGETLGTFCMGGAKTSISFGERFVTTYARDNGTVNVLLIDMLTGAKHRITNMPEGYQAFFPHFVANDWIYFLVWGPDGTRYIGASDAALALAEQQ
jgi:hypothetical protein